MSEHYFYRAAGRSLAVAQDFFRAVDLAEERAKKLQDEIGAKSYAHHHDGPVMAWIFSLVDGRLVVQPLLPGCGGGRR